jgi:hypothetical protein
MRQLPLRHLRVAAHMERAPPELPPGVHRPHRASRAFVLGGCLIVLEARRLPLAGSFQPRLVPAQRLGQPGGLLGACSPAAPFLAGREELPPGRRDRPAAPGQAVESRRSQSVARAVSGPRPRWRRAGCWRKWRQHGDSPRPAARPVVLRALPVAVPPFPILPATLAGKYRKRDGLRSHCAGRTTPIFRFFSGKLGPRDERLEPGGDRPSGLTPNPKPDGHLEIGLLPGFQAGRLNRPSPELRRENGSEETEKPVVTFSNPHATAAKPQETCGSRRYRGWQNARLGNRLEQR